MLALAGRRPYVPPVMTIDRYVTRILDQLLRLRAAGALPLAESRPGSGVWRFGFRAGGRMVSVDLDATVLELRCYHDREEVAMGPVRAETMDVLIGRLPVPADAPRSGEAECLAELRRIVADWRELNPRIDIRPPVKVGHPDNWNHA